MWFGMLSVEIDDGEENERKCILRIKIYSKTSAKKVK